MVNSCLRWLLYQGCFVWRQNSGAYKSETGTWVRYGLTGSSDIIGTTPTGRFIAVECKSEKGKATPEQVRFLAEITNRGGIGVVARSVDDLLPYQAEITGHA